MIRRAFLTLVSRASLAFSVGVYHFKPIPSEIVVDLLPCPPTENIDVRVSPVLQATRDWNDARVQAVSQGLGHLFWGPQEMPRLTKNPKIAGRAIHIPLEEIDRG